MERWFNNPILTFAQKQNSHGVGAHLRVYLKDIILKQEFRPLRLGYVPSVLDLKRPVKSLGIYESNITYDFLNSIKESHLSISLVFLCNDFYSLFSVSDFGSIFISDTQEKFYSNSRVLTLWSLITDILNHKLWRWGLENGAFRPL